MVSVSQQSLSDLCCTRIAYLMWTRQDLTENRWSEKRFDELVDAILGDVENLPLPKKLKSRILPIVNPAGKPLFYLMECWASKTQLEISQPWLTGEMLYECLILNADGRINERKTAEKILSSRNVNEIFAFRLACINFIEKEVLKLWVVVKQWILYRMQMEDGYCRMPSDVDTYRSMLVRVPISGRYAYREQLSHLPRFPYTRECDEVLFWISYCLSKDNATSIKNVPHFIGTDINWHKFSLVSAAYSGNAAGLKYFKNTCESTAECKYVDIIKGNFKAQLNSQVEISCFIFHFMLLDSQEKTELFRIFPRKMVDHFLTWPLSQTFAENIEEIWNLIPDHEKHWVLSKLLAVLFHESPLLNTITDCCGIPCWSLDPIHLVHNAEHLSRIWVDLWEISLDSDKLIVLDRIVFKTIKFSETGLKFQTLFEASDLKKKLMDLFLSNGEAVLELFQGETLKESLRTLTVKYMPEHFDNLDSKYISLLKTQSESSKMEMRTEIKKKVHRQRSFLMSKVSKSHPQSVHQDFFNYIEKNYSQLESLEMPLTKKRKL